MRTYKPLGQRIIVTVLSHEEKKTEGGIVIETSEGLGAIGFQAKRLRGKVKDIGDQVTKLKKNQIILFEDTAPVPLDYTKTGSNNTEWDCWMEEDQVVAIEEEDSV